MPIKNCPPASEHHHEKTSQITTLLATLVLAIPTANASLVLYSSTFSGSSETDLNGTAVNASGATGAQHTQYGTSATATWSAATSLKADGSFVHTPLANNAANRVSGTLPFAPQNGHVYTLTMTTNHAVAAGIADWFATGFFMQPGYSGMTHATNGATVWALTRPGSGNSNGDQVAHYNLSGGAGSVGAPSASEDTTAPSTLTIILDTTGGTGNWSATYHVGNDVLASVADLNAVDIESVGIGVTIDQATFSGGKFQSFELSVAGDETAPVITLKSPPDNATGVSRSSNIVASFDDNILAGTGNITIKDLDDGSTTRVIPVSDAAQVTINGKLLTINPTISLEADRNYAVQIAAGAVKNFSDVAFAGIPASDNITWNFQTLAQSPNVIFILGDDQGWYDYGFMQRPGVDKAAVTLNPSIPQIVKTPAIDRLADEGLAFIHGYSAPVCRPALASIITGTYLQQHWVTGNDLVNGSGAVINDSTVEARMQVLHPLPRTLFNQLGYTSFQTGKWWEGHHTNGGFTHGDTVNSIAGGSQPPQWSGSRPGYVTNRHGDWGLMTGRVDYVNDIQAPAHPIPYANTVQTVTDFINTQVAADQPFFLWYAPFLPHTPHDPPSGLLAQYTALGLSSADANYYANIERLDGGVGAILDHLDAKGIANNTIIIMICDNGRQYDLTTLGKTGYYEWSPNLSDWYAGNGVDGPIGGPTVNTVPSTVGTTTTVTATSSVAVQRLFLRARVAQN